MSENYGPWALPRPDGNDPADVVEWLDNLTVRLTEIFDGKASEGAVLFHTGDFKVSSRTASHGRWLLCDGRWVTEANIESELSGASVDAAEFVTLWGTGSSSIYYVNDSAIIGAAQSGKVWLPDAKGRALQVVGDGAATSEWLLGERFGAEEITLTAEESGLQSHVHGDGTYVVAAHDHATFFTSGPGSGGTINCPGGGATPVSQASHAHLVSGSTDTDAPSVNGSSGTPASVSGGGTGHDDAEQAHDNIQPSIALGNLFVRV